MTASFPWQMLLSPRISHLWGTEGLQWVIMLQGNRCIGALTCSQPPGLLPKALHQPVLSSLQGAGGTVEKTERFRALERGSDRVACLHVCVCVCV